MPNDRDRERAKRRYARRGASAVVLGERRKRNQQILGTVLTVLVVVGGIIALPQLTGRRTPPVSGAAAKNPCPAPTSTPVAKPKSYAKAPAKTLAQGKLWNATVTTSCGPIELELYGDKAPQTVSSFLFLARSGFYAGSPCHRLTTSEALKVLQCGDPTGTGTGGPGYTYGTENVPKDGAYPVGTLAMARGGQTTSNGSQFFLTTGDSTLPTEGGGYSIFGTVTKGMDVLAKVAAGGIAGGQSDGAPARAISIEKITVAPR